MTVCSVVHIAKRKKGKLKPNQSHKSRARLYFNQKWVDLICTELQVLQAVELMQSDSQPSGEYWELGSVPGLEMLPLPSALLVHE